MRKMLAFLMALAMTFQLVMPAWADVGQEEAEEPVAAEEVQEATEETAEEVPEETERETEETEVETTEETEETTEESTEALLEETEEAETEETVEEAENLEAAANSGTCGKNATWTMDGNGHLTISGTGVAQESSWGTGKMSIASVTIESGITGIGESCFSGCQNLTSVEIPDTVTTIARNCFGGCVDLRSLSLPDGVEKIGEFAFTGCKAMKTLRIGKGLKVIHDGAFQGDGNLTALRLPEGVETIGDGAFAGCSSMTTVGLPKSMTSIGEQAFAGCGITDVYYGGSWADWRSLNIGQYNDSLTGAKIHYGTSHIHDFVYVPEKAATCTESGNNAYYLCQECQGVFLDEKGDNETTLDAQTLPALGHSMTEVPEKAVTCAEDGNHAYYVCGICHKVYTDAQGQTETTVEAQTVKAQGHNMAKVDAVAPTRTTTGNNAYYTCDRCGNVYKDRQGKEETTVEAETLPVLGILASGECGENLTWVLDDGGTLTVEGEGYLSRCDWGEYKDRIVNVIIGSGVTDIGYEVFYKCDNMVSLYIPKSVTGIAALAFWKCNHLTEITFEHRYSDPISIEDRAFESSDDYVATIKVPSTRVICSGITSRRWWCPSAKYVSYGNIPMEDISFKSDESEVEVGTPIDCNVSLTPIDTTDDFTLKIVPEKTTADARLSKEGILTALSTGIVTVRAECVENPALNREKVVTILSPTGVLTGLTVVTDNDYPGEAELGKAVQMLPVFTPANAAERSVTWSLQNGTGTATIDENGLLTPLSVGTVTVYATATNGIEGSCTVNIVKYAEDMTILLDGKSNVDRLGVGEGKDLSVQFLPEDTTTQGVDWMVVNGTGNARLLHDEDRSTTYDRVVGQRIGTVTLIATAKDSKKLVVKKELTIVDSIQSYQLPDGSGNLYYNTETGWITGADKTVRNVTIPARIDGVKIVGIAPYVFANRNEAYGYLNENTVLTSVSIPATVEEIGEYAFYRCTAMSALRFVPGENLKTVGAYAFSDCTGLTSLIIPESIEDIEKCAFAGLENLKYLTISGEVDSKNCMYYVPRLETVTFTGSYIRGRQVIQNDDGYTHIEEMPGRNAKKVIISEGVSRIEDNAFNNCDSIEQISFPTSLQIIGRSAFENCDGLKEILFPNGLETIGESAFENCTKLTKTTLPDGLKAIGEKAFRYCRELTEVNLPQCLKTIGKDCFDECYKTQIIDVSKAPDVFMEKRTYLTGMASVPDVLVRATAGKASIVWDVASEDDWRVWVGMAYKDQKTQQWYLRGDYSGTYRLICEDTYTGLCGSKLIEIKTGTLIRPSDTGYLVSGSKLALSAWSMPEEKKTNVWWSLAEGGSEYASIDSKGVLTAKTVYSAQQVTVIAQPTDGSEQATKTVWILPKTTGLGLTLDGGPLGSTLNVDQAETKTLQLSAKVYPEGALGEVNWTSGNEKVARVDQNGLVTLVKPGTAVIKAATRDGTKLTAQVTLNVTYVDSGSKLTLSAEVPKPGLEPGQSVMLTLRGTAAIDPENVIFSVPSNQSAMGSVDAAGLFTAGSKAGNVTVTAALKDDPLGRSASMTIPVLSMQVHTLRAVPMTGDVGEVSQEDGIYEAVFRQTAVEDGYSFRLAVQALDYQGTPMAGQYRYTTSDASIAKVSADGLVTIPKGANGQCVITVQAADALGTKTEVRVSVRDYSPRLETTKPTVNSALTEGTSLVLAASYGNDIWGVYLSDDRFTCSWEDDRLTISASKNLKNGTYPMELEVICDGGQKYHYVLSVKVIKALPKVTVKQLEKFNLFYQDSTAKVQITSAEGFGFGTDNMELIGTEDFKIETDMDGNYQLCYRDPANVSAKPKTKATLRLWLDGCREPVDVKWNIATVNKGPKVTTMAKSSTLNTALTTSKTLRVRLNYPEPWALEAWSETEGVEASIDWTDLCLTFAEAKNTTAVVCLRGNNWAQPVKLTHKITVSNKQPTLKAASTLKLDSLFTQNEAETELVLSQTNLSLVTASLSPAAKAGTAARAESDKLSVTYDSEVGRIVARIADPDKPPKAGTYSFTCVGTLEDGTELSGGVVKVTVAAGVPKVKLSASSVRLNRALSGWERVDIPVTVTGDNRVVDFASLPDGMSYDEYTGKLTVMFSDEGNTGGSYSLYPVVESELTGQRVTLPTKLNLKVQVYSSNKLSVSLTAKGKFNTLNSESTVTYTVNKVSNCLSAVEGVSLEGPDGDKFQAELDGSKAKPVVRLQMLPGQSYATNVGYKIQFRFFVAGTEVLSPMQTIKFTQPALKVTAPKNLVFFQSQTGALRISLRANASIGEVALSAKTTPELLAALSGEELGFDGDRLELHITNPAALKAGKSYSLQLEVTPENNAVNVKPTLVKLTVKVMK